MLLFELGLRARMRACFLRQRALMFGFGIGGAFDGFAFFV
jgi:hypothetical protein